MTNEEFREVMTNRVLRENPPTIVSSGPSEVTADPTGNINWVAKGAVYAI